MANIWDEYERDLFSEKKKKDEKPASSNIWDDLEQEHFNPKDKPGSHPAKSRRRLTATKLGCTALVRPSLVPSALKARLTGSKPNEKKMSSWLTKPLNVPVILVL